MWVKSALGRHALGLSGLLSCYVDQDIAEWSIILHLNITLSCVTPCCIPFLSLSAWFSSAVYLFILYTQLLLY
ncbi:hypothetical protein XELAEV_18025170mg [Xenopus laevis]|uniref:Uncharacterized protein n=1 Tax=Xenopus laevis TaxID=8355 RepID=A0A974D1F7_XENLA|nr:hypothetical protein XELAEV_18025170mg [Xenopus laevis]